MRHSVIVNVLIGLVVGIVMAGLACGGSDEGSVPDARIAFDAARPADASTTVDAAPPDAGLADAGLADAAPDSAL